MATYGGEYLSVIEPQLGHRWRCLRRRRSSRRWGRQCSRWKRTRVYQLFACCKCHALILLFLHAVVLGIFFEAAQTVAAQMLAVLPTLNLHQVVCITSFGNLNSQVHERYRVRGLRAGDAAGIFLNLSAKLEVVERCAGTNICGAYIRILDVAVSRVFQAAASAIAFVFAVVEAANIRKGVRTAKRFKPFRSLGNLYASAFQFAQVNRFKEIRASGPVGADLWVCYTAGRHGLVATGGLVT